MSVVSLSFRLCDGYSVNVSYDRVADEFAWSFVADEGRIPLVRNLPMCYRGFNYDYTWWSVDGSLSQICIRAGVDDTGIVAHMRAIDATGENAGYVNLNIGNDWADQDKTRMERVINEYLASIQS